MNTMLDINRAAFTMFSDFFIDLPRWLEKWQASAPALCGTTAEAEAFLAALRCTSPNDGDLLQEFSDLFYGTSAAVYVPLWASACKNQGPLLLDETTLETVKFYHRWGHTPPAMDGNPPDFIASQFCFVAYMLSARQHAEECRPSMVEEISSALEEFIQRFTLDTLRAAAQAVRRFANQPLILSAIAVMEQSIAAGCRVPFSAKNATGNATLLHIEPCAALLPPLPDAPETVVKTAGLNNCGGRCVITARAQEGCVLEVGTDCGSRAPQLRACVRGRAYRHTFLQGGRLRFPMKRVGKRGEGHFTRITWTEALDILEKQWRCNRENYPPESRYIQYATGNEAVLRGDHMMRRLMNMDGGCLEHYNTYSTACVSHIAPYIYGDVFGSSAIEDVLNTKLLILWGHNPAETLFGTERNYYLSQLRGRGVRVVVVDPRCSDSAQVYADEWIGVRPSTDSALADGMAYVIWTENLADRAFTDRFCLGVDEAHMPQGFPANQSYEAYLLGKQDGVAKTPEWASAICGIAPDVIRRLARDYATTKPACLMPGLGMQRIGNGEQTVRSLALLACLTGNVGIPGGGAAGGPLMKGHTYIEFPVGSNPYPGRIPCFLWSRAVDNAPAMTPETDGLQGVEKLRSGIKMMLCIASNTLVNQHSNINDTMRILANEDKCEFILCYDLFMTASAKWADLLLPAVSVFENNNLSHSWLYGDYVLCNNKVIEPLFEGRFDWEWIRGLAHRLGYCEAYDMGLETTLELHRHMYEMLAQTESSLPPYETFVAEGGFTYPQATPFVAYREERENPQRHPFATPSGKIEVFSPRIYSMNDPAERPAIPKYVPCPEGANDPLRATYPLQLLGWHTKRRAHSVHDNNPWLEEVEPQRLWMNPQDAAERGINNGDIVRVFNARGEVKIPVTVTSRIIAGVVGMPQGAWFTPDETGADVRGCINTLTSTHVPTPFAKGNPQHTNLVEVARCR